MKIADFAHSLDKNNLTYFATVPCTITAPLHQFLENQDNITLFTTYHEHNLPGIAVGYYMATGKPAVLHMQNSGFSNAYDGLLTAIKLYKIPVLILVTWRGDSPKDISEPHQLIGDVTESLTSSIGFPVFGFHDGSRFEEEMKKAIVSVQSGNPTILRIASNVFDDKALNTERPVEHKADVTRIENHSTSLSNRDEVLQTIQKKFDPQNTVFIYSNGYTARAAFALLPHSNSFYNIGYMGGSLAIGYILALQKPTLSVVVIDGDQNAQMSCMKDHLFSTYPNNLHYYIINNKIGASVGNAASVQLASYYKKIAHIIDVPPDNTPFTYSRVSPKEGLDGLLTTLISYISKVSTR